MKKNKPKDKRKYCILAYDGDIEKVMKEEGLETSPVYFMVVKEYSKLGEMIKKEAKKRVNKIKTSQKQRQVK